MSAATEEDLDLSDLDLLDDEQKHARCTFCQPHVTVFISLCGVRALALTDGPANAEPPNACGDCKALWCQPCRRCGA